MAQAKTVKTIPATKQKFTCAPLGEKKRRRTAAYARVSTDHEDQVSSYQAQVDYYTKYIKGRSDWQFVQVYTDEGITGTSTKNRIGFQAMVADALAGNIDLIVTKSVSRFARNTVDSLTTIRKLKEKGVEVYFEKENIWTFDGKGELLLTIMSSLAQEESRSISENCTWGQRKRFADGRPSVAYKRFLGYDRGPNGGFVVNEEEAKVVKLIYALFMQGKTYAYIRTYLQNEGIKTPGGKDKWSKSCVQSILSNEKYKGDALMQKGFTVDFLTKKKKVNEGELPQYYVEGDHEAIIEPELFDLVQVEVERRKHCKHGSVQLFSYRVKCAQCGGWYGPKVWHSNEPCRKTVWQCNDKFKKGKEKCSTPHFSEEELKDLFVMAVNKVIKNKDAILAHINSIYDELFDTTKLEARQEKLEDELVVIAELVDKCIQDNGKAEGCTDEFEKKYNKLVKRYERASKALDDTKTKITDTIAHRKKVDAYLKNIKKQNELVAEFSEPMMATLMDYATVYSRQKVIFTFKDGTDIEVGLEV